MAQRVMIIPLRKRTLFMALPYGSVKATTVSAVGLCRNPPPPADTTTYCFPSRPTYVDGIECAGASSFSLQSSFPFRASNARKRPSIVAPINTRSPAVVMLPPRLGVPVLIPLASSSSKIPSGTCHLISPEFTSTATSSPHGGATQEYLVFGSQNLPPSGVTFR